MRAETRAPGHDVARGQSARHQVRQPPFGQRAIGQTATVEQDHVPRRTRIRAPTRRSRGLRRGHGSLARATRQEGRAFEHGQLDSRRGAEQADRGQAQHHIPSGGCAWPHTSTQAWHSRCAYDARTRACGSRDGRRGAVCTLALRAALRAGGVRADRALDAWYAQIHLDWRVYVGGVRAYRAYQETGHRTPGLDLTGARPLGGQGKV